MRLYVANPTRQKQPLYYRLNYGRDGALREQGGNPPIRQEIPPGRQESIGGDLDHLSQADDIVNQISKYGAVSFTELDRVGERPIAYVYGVDRPVPSKLIEKAYYHNQAVLLKDGAARRKAAAIAVSSFIESPEAKVSFEAVSGQDSITGEETDVKLEEGYIIDKLNDPKGRKR